MTNQEIEQALKINRKLYQAYFNMDDDEVERSLLYQLNAIMDIQLQFLRKQNEANELLRELGMKTNTMQRANTRPSYEL